MDSLPQAPHASSGDDAVRPAEELLAAVASRRDKRAFALLFSHYGPKLKGHLMGRGAEPAAAEEIIQEVMLAVWRKADRFDAARGAASTWLYALARNAFIDRFRHDGRPEVDPDDPLLEVAEVPPAERLLLDREAERELAEAVARLPADQQSVVRQSYFFGRSMSEIAAEGNLPIGTVKTRARLALQHLRALLGRRRDQPAEPGTAQGSTLKSTQGSEKAQKQ